MNGGNVLDDGKSKSGSALCASSRLVDAIEPFEDARQMFRRNARTSVLDSDPCATVSERDFDLHARIRR